MAKWLDSFSNFGKILGFFLLFFDILFKSLEIIPTHVTFLTGSRTQIFDFLRTSFIISLSYEFKEFWTLLQPLKKKLVLLDKLLGLLC